MSKEQKGISRREFLIGAGALAVSAALGGCRPGKEAEATPLPAEKPTVRPTLEPTDKPPAEIPTKKPTEKPTPEPIPSKEEIIRIPGVTITEELLTKAFEGVGGGEELKPILFGTPTPETSPEEPTSFTEFVEIYFPDSWREKITPQELTENPLASLKLMVSFGAYSGVEGVYSPGGISGEEIFPSLSGLNFLRVQIPELPAEKEQQSVEYQEGILPSGFVLRKEAHLTILGKFNGRFLSPELEEMDFAIVASTDWFRKYARKEESIAPSQYLAIVPTFLPGDPENQKALTLGNLLAKAGINFEQKKGEIRFKNEKGEKIIWEFNELEDEKLIEKLTKEVGIYFVDQMRGELLANPIVPFPDAEALELPEFWNGEKRTDEKTNEVFFVITGAKTQDEAPIDLAEARYNAETAEWLWKKIVAEAEKPSWLPEVSNAVARLEDGVWKYYSTDSQEQDQYIVSVKEGEAGYEYFDYTEELNVEAHPEVCVDATFAEIREIMIATGAVKYIPCERSTIDKLIIHQFSGIDDIPGGLIIKPRAYPIRVFYPYNKPGQASPGSTGKSIGLLDVNINKPEGIFTFVQIYALDMDGKPRVMEGSEVLIGTGVQADVGTALLDIKTGQVELLGRREYADDENRMSLDSFARDTHGRLMLPVAP